MHALDTARRQTLPDPALPLAPEEMITDQCLRDLAHGGPERQAGEISAIDTAILVTILPDLCGELLARRLAMRSASGQEAAA
ncbi:hypothetical protein PVW47_01540 [Marinovum sp. SP66]|uniref:hypothetical protein n=1 Tax=Marinovum TaxID=367771 RepID=UPI00237A8F4E|nr:hypothetical protein [Marinovum sp. SP66]MDD9738456.1 hypothetical protein [Marinovum sp. SP66]